jgi:predicted dehydrogenase
VADKVRIGFLGCGMMGQSVHLRNFLKISECEIVAVCDQRLDLAQKVAAKHDLPAAFASHQEMLERVELDAVVAINHAHIHSQQVIDCAHAGKHTYVEKPMAMSSADAQAMVEAAKANGVFCMVAHMKRYDSGVRLARQIMDEAKASGELGKPTHARVHYFCGEWIAGYHEPRVVVEEANPSGRYPMRYPDFMPAEHARPWWGFLQQFCHATNALRFLWGDPDEIRYACWDDFARDAGRCLAVLQIGDMSCAFEAGAMRSHFWDEEYKLYFEKGWVEVKCTPPLLQQTPAKVEVYRADKPAFEYPVPAWGWAFENEARHFVECVREGREPVTSGADTWKDVYLAEQLYLANREGQGRRLIYE